MVGEGDEAADLWQRRRRSQQQLEQAVRQHQQVTSHQRRIFDSLDDQRKQLDMAAMQTGARLMELGIA